MFAFTNRLTHAMRAQHVSDTQPDDDWGFESALPFLTGEFDGLDVADGTAPVAQEGPSARGAAA